MSIKYYNIQIEGLVQKLQVILQDIPEIKIAILFGSSTRRNIVRDLDIGIYPENRLTLRLLAKLAAILEESLGIPVDLVPLVEAPPKLRLKAFTNGVKLVVRDGALYLRLLKQTLSEMMDIDVKRSLLASHPIESKASWKWMSREYAKRKLGLS